MEITELPQWQFQIAMLIGLITFTMAWARGMRRYTPIQDLSQAYKALIIGFIVGAILASALDIWVFRRMYEDLAQDSLYLVEMGVLLLLAGWAEGALCVYLCSRSERKVASAATTTGYAFGIGSAAMTTAVAAVRIFDPALASIGSDVYGFGIDTILVSILIGVTVGLPSLLLVVLKVHLFAIRNGSHLLCLQVQVVLQFAFAYISQYSSPL